MGTETGEGRPNAFIRWIDWVDRPAEPGHEGRDFLKKLGTAALAAGVLIGAFVGAAALASVGSDAPRPTVPVEGGTVPPPINSDVTAP